MANALITPLWTGKEVLRVGTNKSKFAGKIEKMLSDEFKVAGAKVGAVVNVRLPQRFQTTKGQAIQPQSLQDQTVAVTITDQANIAFGWSSASATLEIQEVRKRYVNPAAIQLATTMDSDGLQRCYQEVPNAEGTPGTVPATNLVYLGGGARLTNFACPASPRISIVNSLMRVAIANANLALFNPSSDITKLWREGMFGAQALGFDEWYEDVNIFPHVVGTQGGTPTVNGASQTGSSIVTQAWSNSIVGVVKKGDILTFAGVFAVNPQNYRSTTQLQQFVVTADVDSSGAGAATIPIYPPIIVTGALQTVTASPANAAAITVLGASAVLSPQGLGFHPEAFIMASADLVMPNTGKAEMVRAPEIGLSLRFWEASDIMTDQHPARIDVLYGFKTVRPEWAVRWAS